MWIVLGEVRGKGAGCGRVSRGRWREPAGAGGEEILPRAEPPRGACARPQELGLQLGFTWSPHSSSFVFFFEMYCQYFKAGRFKKKNKNGFLGFL